jgi:uncharacterized GH25 family protein
MKRRILVSTAAFLLIAGSLDAHDMFLKLQTFFLEPNSPASIALINGTFEGSENTIDRARMSDVSIVGPNDEATHPGAEQWRDVELTSWLDFQTGDAGTYVIGVSTAPNMIDLSAEDFNTYLEHDGVLDVLDARKTDGTAGDAASEKYSKHVKAIVQVGDSPSGGFTSRLGYPVELVPLQNPYQLHVGDALDVLFLKDGAPVGDHLIYASHEGYHGHDDAGGHVEAIKARTDAFGIVRIRLSHAGQWYVRLIHMVPSDEDGVDYESNWATLTFEIR